METSKRAEAAYRDGLYEEANALADQILAADGSSTSALFLKGRISYSRREYETAIENFTDVIEEGAYTPGAFNYRGASYLAIGEKSKARYDFEQEYKLDHNITSLYNIALIDFTSGRTERANGILIEILLREPMFAPALVLRGRISMVNQDFDASIVDFNRAIEADPTLMSAYEWRGMAFIELANFEMALNDYDRLLENNYFPLHATFFRGFCLWKLGDTSSALRDFSYVLASNDEYQGAHAASGFIYYISGDFDRALVHLRRANELSPSDPHVALWLYFTSARLSVGFHDFPLSAFDPSHATPWGVALVDLFTNKSTAKELLDAAESIDKSNRKENLCEALAYVGLFYRLQAQDNQGKKYLVQAASDCPRHFIERALAQSELERPPFKLTKASSMRSSSAH